MIPTKYPIRSSLTASIAALVETGNYRLFVPVYLACTVEPHRLDHSLLGEEFADQPVSHHSGEEVLRAGIVGSVAKIHWRRMNLFLKDYFPWAFHLVIEPEQELGGQEYEYSGLLFWR